MTKLDPSAPTWADEIQKVLILKRKELEKVYRDWELRVSIDRKRKTRFVLSV